MRIDPKFKLIVDSLFLLMLNEQKPEVKLVLDMQTAQELFTPVLHRLH